MSSSKSYILPSLFNHHEIEFCRQLLLNQIPNAFLFFDKKSKIIHDFLIELLKLSGNDPIRDVPILMFKWSCRCFYNRIKPPIANPSVPLDFSFVHPELVNFEILYSYVSDENLVENFFRLNDTFPYELFKVISMMKPENAQMFATACGFNSKIPIHMSGRIISIFPLSTVTIDFSTIFRKRCNNSYTNFIEFFEGLLCNSDFNLSQVTAAQLLSDHFDDLLVEKNNDQKDQNDNKCLQLINTSIRKVAHFLDNSFALSNHLFPSQCTTLSFLLQTSAAPFSTLSKAVKKLPPSEYITRFNNQMKLMQVIGLGENWKKLEEHSLPFLIGPEQLSLVPVILVDIPRTSRFLTLQSSDYQKDYDFIHTFLVMNEMLKQQKLISSDSLESLLTVSDSLFSSESEDSFFSDIITDIFSLLFLKKKNIELNYGLNKNDYFDVLGRRKSNSMSLFSDMLTNSKNSTSLSKSGSANYLMNSLSSSSEFVFDADTALNVVSILLNSGKSSRALQPYLERSLLLIRCAMSLFEKPVRIEAVLLPLKYYYLQALTSLDLLEMLIKTFGHPPPFVISRQFALSVSRSLFLRDRSAAVIINSTFESAEPIEKTHSYLNPFSDRLSNDKPLNHRTEEVFFDVLNQFPSELHSLLILDFVSSHKKFTVLAKKNQDKNFDSFVKKLFIKTQRYPHGSILDLIKSKSLNDLQKKLCSIMSFNMSRSILSSFCAFLFLLTSMPSQTYSKFLNDPIENQIIDVINNSDTIQSCVERFNDTGIDALKIILNTKNSKLIKDEIIIELTKFEPLIGIPFSMETTVNKKKLTDAISEKDNFKIVSNYLEEKRKNDSLMSIEFLNEKNFDVFKKIFEEKIDEIINENKVLFLLEKLNSLNNTNNIKFQEKSVLILDYLIYKVNLSPYFEIILSIISNYPNDWSIQFIETFVSLIDPSNEMALFPLQQRLSELKPKNDFTQMTEIMKVHSCWDYLIKEVTRFKNIVKNPEKFYRFCSIHLMSHEVGYSLISLVQAFTQILLFVRNYKIFDENDEGLWIQKFLKYGISSLNETVLAEMTVDIGLNYDYECGKSISNYFITKSIEKVPSKISMIYLKLCSSISDEIKKKLPMSINLITYANNPSILADEILSIQSVKSVEDEEDLLHLTVYLKKFDFLMNLPLYRILYIFAHSSVYLRFHVEYSGNSINDLRDVAELCDLLNGGSLKSILDEIKVDISESAQKKFNDSYSIFGLLQNRSTLERKLLFTSPSVDFNCESILNDAFKFLTQKVKFEKKEKNENVNEMDIDNVNDIISFINDDSLNSFKFPSFSLPNVFSVSASHNSLMVYYESPRTSNSNSASSLTFAPDFKFFDIGCKSVNGQPQLRISPDSDSAIIETIAFSETKTIGNQSKRDFVHRVDDDDKLTDFVLIKAVHDAVVNSALFDLFDSLKVEELKRILIFANDRSLIFFLLQITIWVLEHQEYLKIFVLKGSALLKKKKMTKTNSVNLSFNLSSEFLTEVNQSQNNNNDNINKQKDSNNNRNDNNNNNMDTQNNYTNSSNINEINSENNNDDTNNYTNNNNSENIATSNDDIGDDFDLHKVIDFVIALKFTLMSAIRLADEVDSAALFSPSIIKNGVRKNLDDLCLAIEHQLQIGVKNLNLFEEAASTGNVAHVIAQVFVNYSNDYDRGFALTRVFHADIDEVMIEAAALVATKQQNSEEQLVQFLLAVLPKLNSNSSNQLIQALSSILVRNASNEHFLKIIISGIDSPQSAYQMLRCFNYSEQARDFALMNDLGDEIELSMKDANKRGINYAIRICNRWILQHKQQTS